MIDEQILIEKLKKEISETYHEDYILALERAIEIVKEQPKVGKWIPAEQSPTEFNEYGYSDDVLLKVKWSGDEEIYYDVGWYFEPRKIWSTDSADNICKVIAWMPILKDEVVE